MRESSVQTGKEVLIGPIGNFEVLNGPVLLIFFRTGPHTQLFHQKVCHKGGGSSQLPGRQEVFCVSPADSVT